MDNRHFVVSGGLSLPELNFLHDCCARHGCKNFIEIGRRLGGSTMLFASLAKECGGKVVSIDGSSQYISSVTKRLRIMGAQSYVELITAWSPWVEFDMEWSFDCLLIDGDHTLISALVDYHVFNYFVEMDGLIVWHDTSIVSDAINAVQKRDYLEYIGRMYKLLVYKKTVPRGSMQDIRKYLSKTRGGITYIKELEYFAGDHENNRC